MLLRRLGETVIEQANVPIRVHAAGVEHQQLFDGWARLIQRLDEPVDPQPTSAVESLLSARQNQAGVPLVVDDAVSTEIKQLDVLSRAARLGAVEPFGDLLQGGVAALPACGIGGRAADVAAPTERNPEASPVEGKRSTFSLGEGVGRQGGGVIGGGQGQQGRGGAV